MRYTRVAKRPILAQGIAYALVLPTKHFVRDNSRLSFQSHFTATIILLTFFNWTAATLPSC